MGKINRRKFFKGTGVAAASTLLASSNWLKGAEPAPRDGPALSPDAQAARQKTVDAAIWKSYFDVRRVWGFADRHSIQPGDSFDIMLSTGPSVDKITGKLEVYRIGSYGKEDRKLVWTSPPLTVESHEIQITSASLGVDWPPIIDNMVTDDWVSGYYTFDFVINDNDRDVSVAYIVVNNPSQPCDILVGLSTNTYNAYNAWGGYSLYESAFAGARAQILSFDRPAAPSFFDYDYYLVTWLERLAADHHLTVDYATNFDIHKRPSIVQQCPLFISACHNEYWSKDEFDAVHKRIFKLGKNTMFMGANTSYWQIRYADLNRPDNGDNMGRQLVCYKTPDDPIRQRVDDKMGDMLVTTLYRDGARLPESMLTGVAYQSYFDPGGDDGPKYPYKVADTTLPFFHGTGWKKGDIVGNVVGYEWDNRDPDGDGKRLWDPTLSQIPKIDFKSLQVLFTGNPVDIDGKPGLAESVYFKSPAGAQVFSSGSIRWAWGLGKPGFDSDAFRTFNRNIVLRFTGKA